MKIKELKIYTPNLPKQTDFYVDKIGLDLIEKTEFEARLQIGKSILVLIENDKFQPYHFAINIPSNKEEEALKWLKSRVTILKDGKNEIQDFDFWNAKAIYFYDMDNNIVELIARKNLKNESKELFSSKSFLEISEIGTPANDIEKTYKTLKSYVDIPIFDGGFERFCAIGDEVGLFICINKNIKDWFPTNDRAYSSYFEIEFEENGRDHKMEFKDENFRVVANKL
ncbi:MAG: VOC family protein [Flavobacteriaceae bacterium]|nr:MAG: VOC family protein [Flavobacteriaceae bacterium]